MPDLSAPSHQAVSEQAHLVRLTLCDQCLDGAGGQCNNPDCSLCRRAPDLPLRDAVEFVQHPDPVREALEEIKNECEGEGAYSSELRETVIAIADAALADPPLGEDERECKRCKGSGYATPACGNPPRCELCYGTGVEQVGQDEREARRIAYHALTAECLASPAGYARPRDSDFKAGWNAAHRFFAPTRPLLEDER